MQGAKIRHCACSNRDAGFNLDSHVGGSREEVFAFLRLYWLRIALPFSLKADVSAVVDSSVVLTATLAITGKIEVVASQRIYLLNNPIISALASVLKCKLKPTTAADVSAFTSSLSVFTAKTVNR